MSEATTAPTSEAPAADSAPAADTLLTSTEAAPAAEAAAETSEDGTLITDPAPTEGAAEAGKEAAEGEAETEEREGAPEEYEDFAMPEGVVLDPEAAGELKGIAKEFNLSQAEAQRLADIGGKLVEKWVDTFADALIAQRQGWRETAQAEFDAPQLATAKRALEAYGTPELTKFLNEEGVGNHPEIIRLLARVGETVGEDRFVAGDRANPPQKTLAQRLYPTAN